MIEAGALAGLRILDLTDHKGALCGRLMADMGAEVVKLEMPPRAAGLLVEDEMRAARRK